MVASPAHPELKFDYPPFSSNLFEEVDSYWASFTQQHKLLLQVFEKAQAIYSTTAKELTGLVDESTKKLADLTKKSSNSSLILFLESYLKEISTQATSLQDHQFLVLEDVVKPLRESVDQGEALLKSCSKYANTFSVNTEKEKGSADAIFKKYQDGAAKTKSSEKEAASLNIIYNNYLLKWANANGSRRLLNTHVIPNMTSVIEANQEELNSKFHHYIDIFFCLQDSMWNKIITSVNPVQKGFQNYFNVHSDLEKIIKSSSEQIGAEKQEPSKTEESAFFLDDGTRPDLQKKLASLRNEEQQLSQKISEFGDIDLYIEPHQIQSVQNEKKSSKRSDEKSSKRSDDSYWICMLDIYDKEANLSIVLEQLEFFTPSVQQFLDSAVDPTDDEPKEPEQKTKNKKAKQKSKKQKSEEEFSFEPPKLPVLEDCDTFGEDSTNLTTKNDTAALEIKENLDSFHNPIFETQESKFSTSDGMSTNTGTKDALSPKSGDAIGEENATQSVFPVDSLQVPPSSSIGGSSASDCGSAISATGDLFSNDLTSRETNHPALVDPLAESSDEPTAVNLYESISFDATLSGSRDDLSSLFVSNDTMITQQAPFVPPKVPQDDSMNAIIFNRPTTPIVNPAPTPFGNDSFSDSLMSIEMVPSEPALADPPVIYSNHLSALVSNSAFNDTRTGGDYPSDIPMTNMIPAQPVPFDSHTMLSNRSSAVTASNGSSGYSSSSNLMANEMISSQPSLMVAPLAIDHSMQSNNDYDSLPSSMSIPSISVEAENHLLSDDLTSNGASPIQPSYSTAIQQQQQQPSLQSSVVALAINASGSSIYNVPSTPPSPLVTARFDSSFGEINQGYALYDTVSSLSNTPDEVSAKIQTTPVAPESAASGVYITAQMFQEMSDSLYDVPPSVGQQKGSPTEVVDPAQADVFREKNSKTSDDLATNNFALGDTKSISSFISAVNKDKSATATKTTFFVAMYDFNGEDESYLSFIAGEKLKLVEKCTDDWWSGILLTSGSRKDIGYFPAGYVLQIDRDDRVMQVLYDFTGGRSDELSVVTDDIVVLVENRGQWSEVKNGNGQGLVPTAYVAMLNL